jgi:hypothetical protein
MVGCIENDGTIGDSSFKIIGKIESDGIVRDWTGKVL